MAQGASKNRVQSGRVKSMHLIQWTTSKVFSARGGVHRTIPWVQWYRYQQSTLWCTMSRTNGHGGPAKYAAEIRAVESWVFIDCSFFGCWSLKHTQIGFFSPVVFFFLRIAYKTENDGQNNLPCNSRECMKPVNPGVPWLRVAVANRISILPPIICL